MDYFFCPGDDIIDGFVHIGGEEFAHLVHVMRKKVGDEIWVVDGRGNAFDVRLEEIRRRIARGVILRSEFHHHEPHIDVTLGVGILKNPSKFDFLVEKVTELGVIAIVPLLTERTVPKHARVDRWQKLALAAMKQSGRSYLPHVEELTVLGDFLRRPVSSEIKIIDHEGAEISRSLPSLLHPDTRSVTVLVGPEGGFSEDEVSQCLSLNYMPVKLGDRRLRTETAAIVSVAMLLL